MSWLKDVGVISISKNLVHWTIKDFFKLPQSVDTEIRSPRFRFEEKDCYLYMFPSGLKDSEGWFEMVFFSASSGSFCIRFGFISEGREIVASSRAEWNGKTFQTRRLINRTDFESQRDQMAPNGVLQAFCEIGEFSQAVAEIGALSSCDCYKSMILGGQACDATIKMEHHKFKVHKSILRVHSPFLARAFDEKQHDVICIEDCDDRVFDQLLYFVYSRKLENLPFKNLPPLYCAAEKYCLPDLKQMCVDLMKSSLTKNTVCDVIHLAKTHGETRLLERATNFFARNAENILATEEWQNFIVENTTEANQLLTEAFKLRPYKTDGVVPNEVSEMIYRKMVALTLHPNNR